MVTEMSSLLVSLALGYSGFIILVVVMRASVKLLRSKYKDGSSQTVVSLIRDEATWIHLVNVKLAEEISELRYENTQLRTELGTYLVQLQAVRAQNQKFREYHSPKIVEEVVPCRGLS